MRAAWYDRQGDAASVLEVGDLPTPEPKPGEVRVRISLSGVNPGDTKKRRGWLGSSMPFPRVIPHSDGAGVIDAVGSGVHTGRVGQRVWVFGAQSYRAFGTAAEYTCVPSALAVALPDQVSDEVGACLGIPGITASSWPALERAERVVINFLASEQREVSTRYSTSGIDRFAHDGWHPLPTGEPVISGAAGWIIGRVKSRVPAGGRGGGCRLGCRTAATGLPRSQLPPTDRVPDLNTPERPDADSQLRRAHRVDRGGERWISRSLTPCQGHFRSRPRRDPRRQLH